MRMPMFGMLYFIGQTLYSACEVLYPTGWQLLLSNQMFYRCAVQRLLRCGSFLS